MVLVKSKNIADSELDGEICIFDSNSGEYFNLNSTASFVWKLIDQCNSEDQLIEKVKDCYESDYSDIRKEVEEFLLKSKQLGLINSSCDK